MYKNEDRDDYNKQQIPLPLVNKTEDINVYPLVLNVLTRFWGEEPPIGVIESRSKLYKDFGGSIIMEGLNIASEQFKFSFKIYKGTISELKLRINQGLPLIVILPGIGNLMQFATIVNGYDEDERRFITYIPEPDSIGAIPEEKFISEWIQDDCLTILVYPEEVKDILKNSKFQFEDSNKRTYQAELLKIQGKSQEAFDLLQKTLDEIPDAKENPQLLLLLAGILNEQDNVQCVDYYEKIIEINPNFYLAHRGLGNYYLKKGNYELSKKHYLEALRINPSRYGPIYKNLGLDYMYLGDDASAKESFKQYIKHVPDASDKTNIVNFIES
ncbi:MAG: tetratricopeptide repeat protein [Candidatus Nitrosocosmicus sp.]|jgi:tetratricopeptide (TPR) repeat protein|uniref:tetratricopeptide repeat protein n=1 Tax=Candidatus Nitrosocosmicus agrestis TaxID=2563600 RepID=UPI00122E39A4|nr:tetratricopeptide repeat protein [Candidatus Nitrosocosmicus sp. SS]KAA2278897.1 tetratricopeptide repeat protein [Candidatus Nitrosocosmicus sp. SS]KAF0868114.1 tetratricopeptide repeat protein [Candidatus Nitrosocosmicus sp. SS]MDR4490865.1 tetratricopeptide repeat protein [Candidatus Nitrosocosmicus sp.]